MPTPLPLTNSVTLGLKHCTAMVQRTLHQRFVETENEVTRCPLFGGQQAPYLFMYAPTTIKS